MKWVRGFFPFINSIRSVTLTFLSKLPFHEVFENVFKISQVLKTASLKTNEGAADEKCEMGTRYLTVSFDLAN